MEKFGKFTCMGFFSSPQACGPMLFVIDILKFESFRPKYFGLLFLLDLLVRAQIKRRRMSKIAVLDLLTFRRSWLARRVARVPISSSHQILDLPLEAENVVVEVVLF
ncbi:hypothetical protein Ahy_Scaffold1g107244 isoform D [Arachis hypogaea]|uniref:Uncharacterized protein n=1 Tax=Arachis hypogaea TaxID=3818 RepID=A0A444WV57_ARAHY|nr:hypothetical protein Ahy_Scaffold1g107244 isoform D [Arachis hypogaea]